MSDNKFVFGKKNYVFMLIGLGVLILGFILMASDSEKYGFGFLGLTLGPIVVFLGLITQFYAIFYKEKEQK